MSESTVTAAHSIGRVSTVVAVDESLAWFEQALGDGSVDVTAAFFTLGPQSQFMALDALRSSLRAALQISDIDSARFGAATAAHYRSWLASDEGN